ncbi:hypothetical protein BBJ28_00023701 [Nothophytophthora sp. Chile5]|nr:hypothetical protein BBJ28_00023701 [Nothophytophthora sp. Chile5]
MEVEVRLVRARVWLPSSLFLQQSGFLSLTRVGDSEHVAHATLRSVESTRGAADETPIDKGAGRKKHFRTVLVAWEEQGVATGRSCPKFRLSGGLAEQVDDDPEASNRKKTMTSHQVELPRLDFQLFLLKPRAGDTSARSSRPQIVYIGTSGWQLSSKDVEELVSSREVVFLTALQDELGSLEVSILVLAARLKAEADGKLVLQLRRAADKVSRCQEARGIVVAHLHRSRAAAKIQREYRALTHRRRELLLHFQREEEARVAAKKAKVREKVVARNRQRALVIRARLQVHQDNNYSPFMVDTRPEAAASVDEATRIDEQTETERRKLKERLARLEVERERTLKRMQATDRERASNQHMKQQHGALLDDELISAVRELHFPARYHTSNQIQDGM